MADEPVVEQTTQPAEVEAEEQVADTVEGATDKAPEKDAEFWKGKAKAVENDNKKVLKRLKELEEAEAKRKEAELSETEKLQRKLAEVEARNAEFERREMHRKIADETGLPGELAVRLIGDDEDALRDDAKKLLELIKSTSRQAPKISPTLPSEAEAESEDQKRKRLLNPESANPFSLSGAKKLGGGMYINEK